MQGRFCERPSAIGKTFTMECANSGNPQVFLKVPKCENFHRTDFFYFYTIKNKNSKFKILIFRGSFGGFFFGNFVSAQAECALKNFFLSS